jgi:uncharacterized protein YecT (DUF1311 family)
MFKLNVNFKLLPSPFVCVKRMESMGLQVIAATWLLAVPSPASADIWSTCNAGSNIEMTQCIWERFEAADAELNVVWKQVDATIAPSEFLPAEQAREWKAKLLNAQRAWVTFKEEDCRGVVAYEWFGGSGANAAIGACLYAYTSERTDDLRERYLNR